MKKKVKEYADQIQAGALNQRYVLKDFSRMLDKEVWTCYVHIYYSLGPKLFGTVTIWGVKPFSKYF